MQNREHLTSSQEDCSGDHCLQTWDKWVGIRKKQSKNLAEKTGRPPVDLAMNLLEKVREDKERKTVLENAQLLTKKPTVRGTPFELPMRLPQECYCEPVYEYQRTALNLGKPPVIEHIAVPKSIQAKEKGMSGTSTKKTFKILDTEYQKYRDRREGELKENIKKVDPYRPDLSNFMIKGSKPKPPERALPILPIIKVIEPAQPPGEVFSGLFALRINNTLIYKNIPDQSLDCLNKLKERWNEDCTKWSYYFHVPAKRAGRSKLHLENVGTVAIRYCWKRLKKQIPYIPEEPYDQVFFFNKNEDVLAPGQSEEICFTFISEEPGIFNESWELSPFDRFFDTFSDKLVVSLIADAVDKIKIINKRQDKLHRKISRKAIFNIVRSIVHEAVDRSSAVVPEIYPYKKLFLEAEMFVMKNPVCFYHQTEVGKMKEYYKEMLHGQEWDLSIGSWRKAMMDKDFDDRMLYFNLLKKSHAELLKPWYEGESVLEQKYRAMKLLLGQLADNIDQEFKRLSQLYETSGIHTMSASQGLRASNYDSFIDRSTRNEIRNVFYLHVYEHVANTMEQCAGVLSSIDLNRWIDFDFGRW